MKNVHFLQLNFFWICIEEIENNNTQEITNLKQAENIYPKKNLQPYIMKTVPDRPVGPVQPWTRPLASPVKPYKQVRWKLAFQPF